MLASGTHCFFPIVFLYIESESVQIVKFIKFDDNFMPGDIKSIRELFGFKYTFPLKFNSFHLVAQAKTSNLPERLVCFTCILQYIHCGCK